MAMDSHLAGALTRMDPEKKNHKNGKSQGHLTSPFKGITFIFLSLSYWDGIMPVSQQKIDIFVNKSCRQI